MRQKWYTKIFKLICEMCHKQNTVPDIMQATIRKGDIYVRL